MPAELTERIFERATRMQLLDDLPRLSGLGEARVDAIRRGARYTASEYERLARALAVDPVILYRGEEDDPRRSPARFRAALSIDAPSGHDLRLLALATETGAVLAHLAACLGHPIRLAPHRAIRAIDPGLKAGRQGYDLGEAAREALTAQPNAPLASIQSLLTQCGVHVAQVPFDSVDIDAASVWAPGAVPVVLINTRSARTAHPGALRATLAHELCHLLHDAGEQDLTTLVSWGVSGHGNYAEAVEIRARAFAPAFIAPRSAVQTWAGSAAFPDDETLVRALADHWGLSFEGAAWHAKNCHLIDGVAARRLAHLPRKPPIDYAADEMPPLIVPSAHHPDLPDEPAPLWTGLAARWVVAALAEGHLSLGRARELLTWS